MPIAPRLGEALEALPKRGIWVVSRLDGGMLGYYGILEPLRDAYGRSKVARPPEPIHALRHCFGTEMSKKVPLPVLQRLMGHEDIATTMKYIHVGAEQEAEGIAAVFGAWQKVAEKEKAPGES